MNKRLADFWRSDIGTNLLAIIAVVGFLIAFIPFCIALAKFLPFDWQISLAEQWKAQIPTLVLVGFVYVGIIAWAAAKRNWRYGGWLAIPSLFAMSALYPSVVVTNGKHVVAKPADTAPSLVAPVAESAETNDVVTKMLTYDVGLGSTGSVNVWLVKCVGGPMDGRLHPITAAPSVLMNGGVRKVWVADPSNYEQRPDDPKNRWQTPRGPDFCSVVISTLSIYELEALGKSNYVLRFLGQPDESAYKQMQPEPYAAKQKTSDIIRLNGSDERKTSTTVFYEHVSTRMPYLGRLTNESHVAFCESPAALEKAGITDVLLWDRTGFPRADLPDGQLTTDKMLGQLLLVNITGNLRGIIRRDGLLEATGPTAAAKQGETRPMPPSVH